MKEFSSRLEDGRRLTKFGGKRIDFVQNDGIFEDGEYFYEMSFCKKKKVLYRLVKIE